MPNGWVELQDNAEAVGSMALGARRLSARLAKLHGISREDRRDADHFRDTFREAATETDPIALALSCALVVADAIHGKPTSFKDKLPKEQRWFAKAAHEALHRVRNALSQEDVAGLLGTSAAHCASGILAVGMTRPDGLHEAVAMLDGWTGDLLQRVGHDDVPGTRTLHEAVADAGGFPCAVFAEGRIGFPVIVTGIVRETGDILGFPTTGFAANDFWLRRPSWIQGLVVPDDGAAHWSVAPASGAVLGEAIQDFENRALPEMRRANAGAMYVGSRKMAEALGVTVPRLAAWLRREGLVVRGGEDWVPSPMLGRDSVLPKRDRMGRISWTWSPSFVEELRPKAPEIAQATAVRGPPRPQPGPTDKQVAFLEKLHRELDVAMPDGGYATMKGASIAIDGMVKDQRRLRRQETADTAPGLAMPR